MTKTLQLAVALVLLAFGSLAHAQVYKCTDASGKTTYADAPCGSGSRKLAVSDSTKPGAGNPTVCAQLQDERHRLDAEARSPANRNRAAAINIARQRARVVEQYHQRCAAVGR